MTNSREKNAIVQFSRLSVAAKSGEKITEFPFISWQTPAEKISRENNAFPVVCSRENQARKKHIYKYISLRFAAPVTGGEEHTPLDVAARVSPFPFR